MAKSDPAPGGQGPSRHASARPDIDRALAAGTIDRGTYLVLSVVADLADAAGCVTITRADIAARTTYSLSAVSRAFRKGIQAGLIMRARSGAGNRHGSYGTTYQFLEGVMGDPGLTGAIGSACTRPAPSSGPVLAEVHDVEHPQPRWSEKYRKYLVSPEWQRVIELFKQSRPFTCQFSPDRDGCSGPIQLHHLTYERVFNEDLSDLMPLCRRHHRQLHQHFESERRQDPTTTLRAFSMAWVQARHI